MEQFSNLKKIFTSGSVKLMNKIKKRMMTKRIECIQKYVGSSLKANQVLALFKATRKPKTSSIIVKVAYALLVVYLFQMGLYLMDVITDALVAEDYYQNWRAPNSSKEQCQWNSALSKYVVVSGDNISNVSDLSKYPDCLSDMWKFFYTTGFMVLPTLFYLIEMLRHFKKLRSDIIGFDFFF